MRALASQMDVACLERANGWSVEEVYRQHGARILRWAIRLGGTHIDPDDVVQEVFEKLQKHLHEFRGDSQLTTWLYQMTRNVVGHHRRKLKFRAWLSGNAEETAGHLTVDKDNPLEAVSRQEAFQKLQRILDSMSEKYRTVFVLFEMEEMSGEQIAEIMNARVETVWVWLHRARAQFKKEINAMGKEEGTQ